jgi:hypothetical protein
MLFNSYPFIFLFLPLTLLGFFMIGRRSPRAAAGWLALASLFFYGWWNPAYVGLLLGSMLLNYFCGMRLARNCRQPGSAGLLQIRELLRRYRQCCSGHAFLAG